jgi:uncharacterized protein (DUF58 family)
MFIPTAKVYGYLALGGVLATLTGALLSNQSGGPVPLGALIGLMLAFDAVIGLVWLMDGLQVRSQKVQIHREPMQRLSIGRDNPVAITITTAQSPAQICIYDQYPDSPDSFAEIPMPLRVTCPAKSTQTLTYSVYPQARGEYQWGDLQIRQQGPWGFAWHSWKVPQAQKVAVYPDLVGLRSLSVKLAIQSTGSMRQLKRIGIGTEFAELREYGLGDDPRLIDWKATARRSSPLIRVLEPEREQTLIVLLDRGRLMTAQVKGLNRFDWGLNATLSLALAGLHRGDRVGVGVFDRTMHTWIPPTGGKQHLQHLIEKLTPIQPVLLESDYLGAVTKLATQQQRRALVVLITDIVDRTASAELLAALTRLKNRHLPFCVTLRDPQVDLQANTFETSVSSAYNRAVALDLLAQRQAAFLQLKQSSVMVLDAPANQINEPLIDEYLRIKAKNRL